MKIEFETISLKDPDENGTCREFVEASVSFKIKYLFNDERQIKSHLTSGYWC